MSKIRDLLSLATSIQVGAYFNSQWFQHIQSIVHFGWHLSYGWHANILQRVHVFCFHAQLSKHPCLFVAFPFGSILDGPQIGTHLFSSSARSNDPMERWSQALIAVEQGNSCKVPPAQPRQQCIRGPWGMSPLGTSHFHPFPPSM